MTAIDPISKVPAKTLTMSEANNKAGANIRLALILGVIALGFFALGMYLASGGGQG